MATSERTLKSMLTDQFTGRVASTANRLRVLADELENHANGIARVPCPGIPSATSVAHTVVHRFIWGMANASVDAIIESAEEYDRVLAKERAAELRGEGKDRHG